MKKLLSFNLLLTVFIFLIFCFVKSETIYDEQDDPTVWPGLCQTGQKQSPIDLVENTAIYLGFNPSPLLFNDYDKSIGDIELQNDGKSIHVSFLNPNFHPTVTYEGQNFPLIQFHFHWGNSEHAFNGELYDGEIHLVHIHPTNSANIIVLGALLEKTDFSNNIFNEISDIFRESVQNIKNYNETYVMNLSQNLQHLLYYVDLDKYLTYEGSLTTPDCDEIVRWIVFRDIIGVDKEAIEDLTEIKDKHGENLLFTNRQIQQINSRNVYRTY